MLVTNTSEVAGVHTVTLKIDDLPEEYQKVALGTGAFTTAPFETTRIRSSSAP